MNKTDDTFVLFSIGPVQSFLSAARRTRDLFAGSTLLSHLASEAVKVLLDGDEAEMIFPRVDQGVETESPSIPNRVLCRISGSNAEDYAKQAADKVNCEFTRIAKEIAQNTPLFGVEWEGDQVWKAYWTEQAGKFLQVYYVTCPAETADNYASLYRQLDATLGQRKLLRNFEELHYWERSGGNKPGQNGIKCSLVPNLSAVHPRGTDAKHFWETTMQAHAKRHEFRKNERLSAVALTKRRCLKVLHPGQKEKFPSTSTLAAGGYYRALWEEIANQTDVDIDLMQPIGDLAAKVRALTGKLHAPQESANYPALEVAAAGGDFTKFLQVDGDWLHPESYNEDRLMNEYNIDPVPAEAGPAREALATLLQEVTQRNNNIRPPGKYYAILFFDGDEMGKRLTEIVKGKEFNDAIGIHKNVSEALRTFSTQIVKKIVEGTSESLTPRLGKVIYSGGDDVLAFCALDDLFDILRELRIGFSETLKSSGAEADFSGSVGVAIAHHQTNLQQVLDAARRAEQHAKITLEKDAVSVALLKRSGEHSITGCRWLLNGENPDALTVLKEFASLIQHGAISTKFIYDLHQESIGLEGIDRQDDILMEVKRLLLRHSKPEQKAQVTKFLDDFLSPLLQRLNDTRLLDMSEPLAESVLRQLIDLLEVGQFVGQGGRQ